MPKLTIADIDECKDDTHNCHPKADCSNSHGSFNCACFQGYSGDGVTCTGMMVFINYSETISANLRTGLLRFKIDFLCVPFSNFL